MPLRLASLPFPIHNYFVAAKYGYLTLQLAVDPSCNSCITYLIRSFCYLRIFVLTSHTQRRDLVASRAPPTASTVHSSHQSALGLGIHIATLASHHTQSARRCEAVYPFQIYTSRLGISPASKQQRRSKSLVQLNHPYHTVACPNLVRIGTSKDQKNEGDQRGAKLKRTATKAIPLATFLSPPNLSPFIEECQPFNFGIINICVPALAIELQPTGANKSNIDTKSLAPRPVFPGPRE